MSGINGDKSRFHRERKQKIARRKRNRELLRSLAEGRKLTAPASVSKPKAVSAWPRRSLRHRSPNRYGVRSRRNGQSSADRTLWSRAVHHRGQLSVYLRLLEVPVPVINGRSADENPFAWSHGPQHPNHAGMSCRSMRSGEVSGAFSVVRVSVKTEMHHTTGIR